MDAPKRSPAPRVVVKRAKKAVRTKAPVKKPARKKATKAKRK